ncbi:Protein OS-9 [Lobulomyces angularis]|nr:Protein OS-9 [Lobulomyces angularis]
MTLRFTPRHQQILINENTEVLDLKLKDERYYYCRIPKKEKNLNKSVDNNNKIPQLGKFLNIFKSIDNQCLLLNKGWWTYQFCFNSHLSQIHVLNDVEKKELSLLTKQQQEIKKNENNFILGLYSDLPTKNAISEKNEKEIGPSSTEIVSYKNSEDGETSFIRQKWSGGTFCEIKMVPRTVEVEYHCLPNTEDHIAFFKETSLCNYQIIINTWRICDDIAFVPKQKENLINLICSPRGEFTDVDSKLNANEEHDNASGKYLSIMDLVKLVNYESIPVLPKFKPTPVNQQSATSQNNEVFNVFDSVVKLINQKISKDGKGLNEYSEEAKIKFIEDLNSEEVEMFVIDADGVKRKVKKHAPKRAEKKLTAKDYEEFKRKEDDMISEGKANSLEEVIKKKEELINLELLEFKKKYEEELKKLGLDFTEENNEENKEGNAELADNL